MNDWKKFNEISLSEKEDFYSHLNLEDVTDSDCSRAKRVFKHFKINNLGEHYDMCAQSDTLLLADVFENFQSMYLEIDEPDPAHFHTAQGLAWQAALKMTKVKLDLLTDINMLLIIEKHIRGEICHSTHGYAKANNKRMKDYDKIKNHHILNIGM